MKTSIDRTRPSIQIKTSSTAHSKKKGISIGRQTQSAYRANSNLKVRSPLSRSPVSSSMPGKIKKPLANITSQILTTINNENEKFHKIKQTIDGITQNNLKRRVKSAYNAGDHLAQSTIKHLGSQLIK